MTVERWDDDRLDRFAASTEQGFERVRQLTESNAGTIQALGDQTAADRLKHEEWFTRMEQLTESNARAIQAATNQAAADRLKHEEWFTRMEQLTESNARAIQAFGDDVAEYKLTTAERMEQNEARMQQLQEAMLQFQQVANGLVNITVAIDEDRPTMLRLLNSIENKVDRLIERQRGNREGEG
jgi:phage gp36-like protein